ncbi:ABC transporter ATP-binding protein [Pediococcus argentinicus]|uniref:Peptide ABC transporter ATPase n=1 Tax=Pediococcus argentinicus TaxID=480391 RepID=A0A0R2NJZ7_9LACO|nr:ABC transporter ATP-binding protein [Pediococcus argentinicus]KRO26071.1 peptide ABC transporter ATPase [Pediococcus argentinicus]NKZ21733.1 ABC transporter ATP-binding protein [Pediococcus argentinicus]GEP18896.1 ABC transporter ATP-binding protein [Pediococcus argentinicus]
MSEQPIISVSGLRKTYGGRSEKQYEALKGIDFDVQPGEFVGIMGASGSGKTTLLNMLATLDQPTSGTVKINGSDVTKLHGNKIADFRANEIGFIFQDFNLLETLTAFENIALPLSLQGVRKNQIKTTVYQIAAVLSISNLLDKYPTELSGGQKQRVAAARGIVHNPSLLLGDEPTGALDSKSARELLELLTQINQERDISVLLVTHDPFSASFCNRILFIKDGVIGQEIKRNDRSRNEFYQEILEQLGTFEQ